MIIQCPLQFLLTRDVSSIARVSVFQTLCFHTLYLHEQTGGLNPLVEDHSRRPAEDEALLCLRQAVGKVHGKAADESESFLVSSNLSQLPRPPALFV